MLNQTVRLKTEVLVGLHKEGDIDYENCLKNITQIGGVEYLDQKMLHKGILEMKEKS